MNEDELLRAVCAQNKRLAELGLVILTEGNVSQWDGDIRDAFLLFVFC
ncbi:MAG: hypothetical protein UX81_C0004G0008 [Parcubacteria group bacterium GW2011_GWA2_47_12]|nr:MAG: hypothetical protein UX81_C0004G0008 [Parcubacteria group bacterium GW2011_GWA2_47_12]